MSIQQTNKQTKTIHKKQASNCPYISLEFIIEGCEI